MNVTKTILAGLVAVSSVFALPTLQLDISGGVYNGSTETVVNTSNQFDLIALLNSSDYTGTYYISMAVTPTISMSADIGSFDFNGTPVSIADMHYGTPPVALAEVGELPTHGIFPTYFYEYAFSFSGDRALPYNVENNPGSLMVDPAGTLYYQAFTVDVSALNPNYGIHFDLYNEEFKNKKSKLGFAPFSHDAEASLVIKDVPEPVTLSLFGMGLLALSGMGLFRRRN